MKRFLTVRNDIEYYPKILAQTTCDELYLQLLTHVKWKNELKVIGSDTRKKIRRKMCYMADEGKIYQYANFELPIQNWIAAASYIRFYIEKYLNVEFNSVLLNLYEDGRDEIKWHSEKEDQLGENPVIAAFNLGATRNFWFMEKATGFKSFYSVSHGDLLVMGENCQRNYLHAILKEKEVTTPRISLTFRKVYNDYHN